MRNNARTHWVISVPGDVLHEHESKDSSLPEGQWERSGPVLTVLRRGVCVSTVEALGRVVASRLQDAEELSHARRPASTAAAYRSAHALAATRCLSGGAAPQRPPRPEDKPMPPMRPAALVACDSRTGAKMATGRAKLNRSS